MSTPLHSQAAEAVAALAGVPCSELKVDATPRAELGDLAVGCFAIAKARGLNPTEVAKDIAARFTPTPLLASATAAGPFVNFRANRAAVFGWLIDSTANNTLLPKLGTGQTIVIDYSSPNVSKPLAYHHIRSTMIGHSLVQIFRALDYTVVGLNHLGDWGTTHGKLIAAWKLFGPIEPVTTTVLADLAVRFTEAAKTDPTLVDQGRAWFKKLEDGDAEARALWQRFYDVSIAEYQSVYDLLGVKFDIQQGESEYMHDVPRVLAELADKQLSSESDGALIVAFDETLKMSPLMLKKRDGATTYATRDIPSAEWRWSTYHFARSLYVVDRGQSLHFRQLFKTLALMGREWAARCEHIPFGLVQIGGKKGSTRSGNVILLKEVVAEAEQRVRALLAEINPDLPNVDEVARTVGIGAIVFANLASQRDKDVAFEWDRVIALQGDSGAYLQYSHARCASIMRKANVTAASTPDFEKLAHDAEWAVARKLVEFPAAVAAVTPKCEPHIVCHYLLDLAGEFSRWYTLGNGDPALRVLCDDEATRTARLALVGAVQTVLRVGLALLGVNAPDVM